MVAYDALVAVLLAHVDGIDHNKLADVPQSSPVHAHVA